MLDSKLNNIIACELNVNPAQVMAAMQLIDEGCTVPFIARYRKEATGGLDDTQLRTLSARLAYLRELSDRKKTILKSISEQNKLTPELSSKIDAILNKTELEELYLPYKPKRRTKGQIAIEAGIEPLADSLWQSPSNDPKTLAVDYIDADKGFADEKAVLDGAKYILMERFAEDATLLAKIRHYLLKNAHITAKVIAEKEQEAEKFKDYFDYSELLNKVPSHRALALFRGRNEGFLTIALNADPLETEAIRESYCEQIICQHLNVIIADKPADAWRKSVISWTWRIKILMYMESDLMSWLREKAEDEAINVFAANLKDMLMAAPAGMKVTMGMDPGLRTGVKIAVVDSTGKLLETQTIYPHTGQADRASDVVAALCLKHSVELVAIGNGTASRETERFYLSVQKKYPQITAQKVIVSEAGASVYSASEIAAKEFPQLDVSLRGAASIARRLQDPLAELVKIDPKSIGVGQYQHDVSQIQLAKKLEAVVEDCVNAVGVNLNTASMMLLSHIAGLNQTIAQNIVDYRDQNGQFSTRKDLLKVPRLGPKAFEQCAGFLRIINGKNPLDSSAVHPEAYPVVEKILTKLNQNITELMGNSSLLRSIKATEFTDETFGLPTVTDIIKELEKPGRDPRPEFKTANLRDDIETINDLKVGMILEGTITNVTNFGAFVDLGVHQDGLVHISLLSNQFVEDPRTVVKTGDIVKVKVIEVEVARKRIALSMRLDEQPKPADKQSRNATSSHKASNAKAPITNSAMGIAFASAFKKKS